MDVDDAEEADEVDELVWLAPFTMTLPPVVAEPAAPNANPADAVMVAVFESSREPGVDALLEGAVADARSADEVAYAPLLWISAVVTGVTGDAVEADEPTMRALLIGPKLLTVSATLPEAMSPS